MDVMEVNSLRIEYNNDLIYSSVVDDILDLSLDYEMKLWLDENNIKFDFEIIWHTENLRFDQGPFHGEITFESEQDKLAFVLRWM
jgi:hypothetical protein